jgi:type II secretory pathway component PulC
VAEPFFWQEMTKMKLNEILILLALTIATLIAVGFIFPEKTAEICSIITRSEPKTTQLIKGIVYSEGSPSVLIGSQILSEGDTIDGVTVIRIGEDRVEFGRNGWRWTQVVNEPTVP